MSSNSANRFMSSFMQGYSFIDDINSRKRQEKLLEERISEEDKQRDFLRQRLLQQDAERGADRATGIVARQRREAANRLLADPNTPDEDLAPYSDIPEVAQYVRDRKLDARDQADLEIITRGEGGLVGAVSGQQPAGQQPAGQQPPGGLVDAVQPAPLPANEFEEPQRLTTRELNDLADQDPQAAMAARDEISTEKEERYRLQRQAQAAGLHADERPLTQAERERVVRRSQQDQVNNEWDAYLDIEDASGDGLRQLDPNILTAKYFDDRENITDLDRQTQLDKRMIPNIQATIATQQEILQTAGPEGQQTPEARNARRKLSEAYGLANTIHVSYKPLRQAGVDARGLPANGANAALTDAVVDQIDQGSGSPLPPNPNTTRADLTMLSRGTKGRVSERFAQAAFRQYKNARITRPDYESLIRTGHLPMSSTITQTDPTKDTWANITNPDGTTTRKLIIPARTLPKAAKAAAADTGRNLLDEDGLKHLNNIASAFNTKDDPTRGTMLSNSFITALAANEGRARQAGYDLSSVNDVGLLFQRWTDLHVIRDAYNDEWFYNGRFNPDFTQDYGTLDEALFKPSVDKLAASGELEIPGTTTLGMFGTSPRLLGTKGRDPAVYNQVRQQFPEYAQSSDAEIEAAIAAQQGR